MLRRSLLSLYSGITSGGAGNWTQVCHLQGKSTRQCTTIMASSCTSLNSNLWGFCKEMKCRLIKGDYKVSFFLKTGPCVCLFMAWKYLLHVFIFLLWLFKVTGWVHSRYFYPSSTFTFPFWIDLCPKTSAWKEKLIKHNLGSWNMICLRIYNPFSFFLLSLSFFLSVWH